MNEKETEDVRKLLADCDRYYEALLKIVKMGGNYEYLVDVAREALKLPVKEKCPNPNCKDGWVGVLDTGLGHRVACSICQGAGEVRVLAKKEYPESRTNHACNEEVEGRSAQRHESVPHLPRVGAD